MFKLIRNLIVIGLFGAAAGAHASAISYTPPPYTPQVTVNETVTPFQGEGGGYQYTLSLTNSSTGNGSSGSTLTDFYLPYFRDEALSHFLVPSGLGFSILNSDMFNLGHGALTTHIYNLNLPETFTSATLSYVSPYAAIKAPYSAVIGGVNIQGDPFIPGSPLARAALPQGATVPEPGTIALLGLGLFGFCVSRRKSAK